MKFELVQIDSRSMTARSKNQIEDDLNVFVEKLEKNGYTITSEVVAPESSSVKNFFLFTYDKGEPKGLKYRFMIFDVRSGPSITNVEMNVEVSKLEKEGREIIRHYFLPRTNTAFCSVLLAHVPKKKVKESGGFS